MTRKTALTILRLTLGIVAGGYAAALVVRQVEGETHLPFLVLGIAEMIGGILLVIPRTVRAGGIALLVVFGLAAALHALHGDFGTLGYLAVYAAAAGAVIARPGEAA